MEVSMSIETGCLSRNAFILPKNCNNVPEGEWQKRITLLELLIRRTEVENTQWTSQREPNDTFNVPTQFVIDGVLIKFFPRNKFYEIGPLKISTLPQTKDELEIMIDCASKLQKLKA
jgi:hypothetical protein